MNEIFSADKNWGIGCGNDLLFKISEDLKYFKSMTTGKTVVMGYNTLMSLPGGKPLPNRRNIVLSRKSGLVIENAEVACSIDELWERIKGMEEDVFIIGGGQIYRELLPYCRYAYVTKVNAVKEADTYMQNLDTDPGWQLIWQSEEKEDCGYKFSYCKYENLAVSKL